MQPMPNGNGNQLSSPSSGDICKPLDVVGHLLVVRPVEFLPDFATSLGARDAVRIDVCNLNALDDRGQPGVVYRDALWFGRMLVSGLRRQIGETVLGRMAQGVAKPGQNPPFNLVDMMADPGAVNAAQTWLNAHPEFFTGQASSSTPAAAQPQPTQTPYNPAGQTYVPPQPTPAPGYTQYSVQPATTQATYVPPAVTQAAAPAPRPAVNPNADPWGSMTDEQRNALAALGLFQPTT